MRRLLIAAVFAVAACGDPHETGAALAGHASASATPVPSPTALPDGVIPAADIEQRMLGLTAIVLRADRVALRLMDRTQLPPTFSDHMAPTTTADLFWLVAVVGEFRPSFGIIARPNYPCGLMVLDARTGDVLAAGGGALKSCAPYFNESLVPPPAPVSCGSEPQGYGYPGSSPTTPGAVRLTIARDDGWRMPSVVSADFLYGGGPYYEAFCRAENIVTVPGQEDRILAGLGSPQVTGTVPSGQAQLWLKNYHALEATATSDRVRVIIEPRRGFEIASFDWRAVAPHGGYVNFEFVDRSGKEVLPFRVANGP